MQVKNSAIPLRSFHSSRLPLGRQGTQPATAWSSAVVACGLAPGLAHRPWGLGPASQWSASVAHKASDSPAWTQSPAQSFPASSPALPAHETICVQPFGSGGLPVAQRLRLQASDTAGTGCIPGQETESHRLLDAARRWRVRKIIKERVFNLF